MVTNRYQHFFFDLDRTLWDYETNAKEALDEIFRNYAPYKTSFGSNEFAASFAESNEKLWLQFRNHQIKKATLRSQRFHRTLLRLGINDQKLALQMESDYIRLSPLKSNLILGVLPMLEYLSSHYQLHIITNGFDDVQFKKIENSGIKKYFNKVITSDTAGTPKPNSRIFHHALSSANARKKESLMIGDDWEVDIMGAMKYGIDQVYFNPRKLPTPKNPTFNIYSMEQMCQLF